MTNITKTTPLKNRTINKTSTQRTGGGAQMMKKRESLKKREPLEKKQVNRIAAPVNSRSRVTGSVKPSAYKR